MIPRNKEGGGGGNSNHLLTTETAWKGNFLKSFVHACTIDCKETIVLHQ